MKNINNFKNFIFVLIFSSGLISWGTSELSYAAAQSIEVDKMVGVTIDSITKLPDIINSLKNLAKKPTTRIVFDELVPATYYQNAVAQIQRSVM